MPCGEAGPATHKLKKEKVMYIVSDVVEMGAAHELVLSVLKTEFLLDDTSPETMPAEQYFDE